MTTTALRPGRWARVAGVGLAVAALLSACGGSSGDAASSSASGQASATGAGGNTQVLLDNQQLTVLDQPIAYPKKKPARVTSSILVLEPGQETGWQKTNVPTYAYVLDGTITVEYDAGVTKEFPAGTAFMQAQGVWNNSTNKADQAAHVLLVNLGAKGVKSTVKRQS